MDNPPTGSSAVHPFEDRVHDLSVVYRRPPRRRTRDVQSHTEAMLRLAGDVIQHGLDIALGFLLHRKLYRGDSPVGGRRLTAQADKPNVLAISLRHPWGFFRRPRTTTPQ